MTQAAIARQRRRRRGSGMNGKNSRPAIVLFVAPEARHGGVGPSLFARANVAFRTIGENVHPRQRKASEPMDVQRPRHAPACRRVTIVARLREAPAVEIVVAARAGPLQHTRRVVAVDAGRGHVRAGEGKPGGRVIELPAVGGPTLRAPCRRRVTRGARHVVREVSTARRRRTRFRGRSAARLGIRSLRPCRSQRCRAARHERHQKHGPHERRAHDGPRDFRCGFA